MEVASSEPEPYYLWHVQLQMQFQGTLLFLIIVVLVFMIPPWRTARVALHGGVSKAIASQGQLLLQEAGGGV